ncbi:hypothetical protein GFM09_32925 [Rhizobium leguminosarum bv. viciae]|nr:hypothetical protein [Rhizobium leguminosarum bv. viciae]
MEKLLVARPWNVDHRSGDSEQCGSRTPVTDEQRAPPVNMGNSREAGDGVADAAPETGRSDAKTRIAAPQAANRE